MNVNDTKTQELARAVVAEFYLSRDKGYPDCAPMFLDDDEAIEKLTAILSGTDGKPESGPYYCPKHKYNPPENSGFDLCPQCESAPSPIPAAKVEERLTALAEAWETEASNPSRSNPVYEEALRNCSIDLRLVTEALASVQGGETEGKCS